MWSIKKGALSIAQDLTHPHEGMPWDGIVLNGRPFDQTLQKKIKDAEMKSEKWTFPPSDAERFGLLPRKESSTPRSQATEPSYQWTGRT